MSAPLRTGELSQPPLPPAFPPVEATAHQQQLAANRLTFRQMQWNRQLAAVQKFPFYEPPHMTMLDDIPPAAGMTRHEG